jgi:hypothetical protein
MNCEKHLNKALTNILLLSALLSITACSKQKQKDDYIARVNESYLTREEFASLVDTSKLNSFQKEQIIKNWIYNELLFQEAVRDGIVKNDDFKKILKNSERQLANAMFLKDLSDSEEIDFSDQDLIEYYENNNNYFRASTNSYLINRAYFKDEDRAIRFRELALATDWDKSIDLFIEDSSFHRYEKLKLIEEIQIYPLQLSRIIGDLNTKEISIVITEKPGYYSIVQILEKYTKETILPFESTKDLVTKRFIAEKKTEIIENYLKELYSKNEIEIKNEN